jgi:hypothetical protein
LDENKTKYLNAPEKQMNKRTLHEGNKIKNPELECKLIEFIEFNRKLYNAISTWSLLLKMFEICPKRKNLSIKSNQKFINGFLKINFYFYRTKTHVGQILSKNCFTQASLFLNEILDKRLNFKFANHIIGNMDETPLFQHDT